MSAEQEFKPDWINAATCIENAIAAYDDSVCMSSDDPDDDEGIPVNTDIMSGDLSTLIGLANVAVRARSMFELCVRNGHSAREALELVGEVLGIEGRGI